MTTIVNKPVAQSPARFAPMRHVGNFFTNWGVIAGLVIVWEIVARVIESVYFPPMSQIFQALFENYLTPSATNALFMPDAVGEQLIPSLGRLAIGYGVAVGIAVLLGVFIGLAPKVEDYLDPVLQFLRAIPPPAVIPIFLIFLGIGDSMKILMIVFAAIWPVLINTIDGVRQVPQQLIETAHVYGASGRRRAVEVIMPAAAPRIFAGMRIALSIAIVVMVLSEMVAATNGLGYSILFAQRTFRMTDMWAGIILLGAIGYLLNLALSLVENRVLAWHRNSKA